MVDGGTTGPAARDHIISIKMSICVAAGWSDWRRKLHAEVDGLNLHVLIVLTTTLDTLAHDHFEYDFSMEKLEFETQW